MRHWILIIILGSGISCTAGSLPDRLKDNDFGPRQQEGLRTLAARPLPLAPNPSTWVDEERWSVAHARLALNTDSGAMTEANRYLTDVAWVSLWRGLVADTDIQVTDLLRSWFEFSDSGRLTPEAKTHLLKLFTEWVPPNRDRNRFANLDYHWPAEYTENHSLNILTAAYLIDTILAHDRTRRTTLLRQFMHDRARWGWSEFYSPNYAIYTAKPLSLLADFAPDEDIRTTATLLLDLLVIDFSTHGLNYWRGMPFARGSASGMNNRNNSMVELIRHWFGDSDAQAHYTGGTALAHLLTSRYRPPAIAARLLRDPVSRGTYTIRQTATHGPAKLRVPIVTAVTPTITMSSAGGSGNYYDGHYWSISFASSPEKVITGPSGEGRNLLQIDTVMAVFGPMLKEGNPNHETLTNPPDDIPPVEWFAEGENRIVHLELATNVHLFMLEHALPQDGLVDRIRAMNPTWHDGTVAWTRPQDERRVRMCNHLNRDRWIMDSAWMDDKLYVLDHGFLHDSPYLRSQRDSARFQWRDSIEGWVYDLSDSSGPQITKAKAASLPPLPPERVSGPLGFTFIRIPAGEYPSGARGDEGRAEDAPFAWRSTDAFYLAQTETTVAQYHAFLAETSRAEPLPDEYFQEWGKQDDYPQTLIDWREAGDFCVWLTARYPGRYRLPTQMEWEKAARGWQYRVYPWGDTYDGSQSGTPNGQYAPVGSKPGDRSPFDILDMAGNAWEWCADEYPNPEGAAWRTLRGCSWNFDPDTFRIAYRSGWEETGRSPHIGFRVVYEPE